MAGDGDGPVCGSHHPGARESRRDADGEPGIYRDDADSARSDRMAERDLRLNAESTDRNYRDAADAAQRAARLLRIIGYGMGIAHSIYVAYSHRSCSVGSDLCSTRIPNEAAGTT